MVSGLSNFVSAFAFCWMPAVCQVLKDKCRNFSPGRADNLVGERVTLMSMRDVVIAVKLSNVKAAKIK